HHRAAAIGSARWWSACGVAADAAAVSVSHAVSATRLSEPGGDAARDRVVALLEAALPGCAHRRLRAWGGGAGGCGGGWRAADAAGRRWLHPRLLPAVRHPESRIRFDLAAGGGRILAGGCRVCRFAGTSQRARLRGGGDGGSWFHRCVG